MTGTLYGKPTTFLPLPWGHWLYMQYRAPRDGDSALGLWLTLYVPTSISVSVALIAVSFVFGYRWGAVEVQQAAT